jgi:hypothetical protein
MLEQQEDTAFRRWSVDVIPGSSEREVVPGLRSALRDVGLQEECFFVAADKWCLENGAAFLSELVEEAEAFSAALEAVDSKAPAAPKKSVQLAQLRNAMIARNAEAERLASQPTKPEKTTTTPCRSFYSRSTPILSRLVLTQQRSGGACSGLRLSVSSRVTAAAPVTPPPNPVKPPPGTHKSSDDCRCDASSCSMSPPALTATTLFDDGTGVSPEKTPTSGSSMESLLIPAAKTRHCTTVLGTRAVGISSLVASAAGIDLMLASTAEMAVVSDTDEGRRNPDGNANMHSAHRIRMKW